MLKAGFVWLLESKTIFKFYLIYLTDTLTISATGEVIPSCLQAIQSPRYLTRGTIYEGKWTKQAKALNFRRGSRCPKIAFWQSKFPKNGSLSINYCDIFEKIV